MALHHVFVFPGIRVLYHFLLISLKTAVGVMDFFPQNIRYAFILKFAS